MVKLVVKLGPDNEEAEILKVTIAPPSMCKLCQSGVHETSSCPLKTLAPPGEDVVSRGNWLGRDVGSKPKQGRGHAFGRRDYSQDTFSSRRT